VRERGGEGAPGAARPGTPGSDAQVVANEGRLSTLRAQDAVYIPEPRWDPTDPVSVAEKAEFTVRWITGIDDGDIPAAMGCFKFTKPVPSFLPYIYQQEVKLFQDIYEHRLSSNYSFFQLLTDDPKVRHQFRDYVLTGKLETPLENDDALALVKHIQAIADALQQAGQYESVDGYEVVDGKLVSDWLKVKDEPPQELPAPPTPDPNDVGSCLHKWFLKCLPEGMLLACLKDKGLYHNSIYPWVPDFDCDDYAWMSMNWMRRTLKAIYPNSKVLIWNVCWTCPPPGKSKSCHSILKIINGGLIWYYDPQTDQWLGPYGEGTMTWEEQLALMKQLLQGYATCPDGTPSQIIWDIPMEPDRPWHWLNPRWPEAPPFDEPIRTLIPVAPMPPCVDLPAPNRSWELFKQLLDECCQTLVHPTHPAVPTGDPNCPSLPGGPNDNLSWWPDLCNPDNYTWPVLYP
jgi:hypothetical protein